MGIELSLLGPLNDDDEGHKLGTSFSTSAGADKHGRSPSTKLLPNAVGDSRPSTTLGSHTENGPLASHFFLGVDLASSNQQQQHQQKFALFDLGGFGGGNGAMTKPILASTLADGDGGLWLLTAALNDEFYKDDAVGLAGSGYPDNKPDGCSRCCCHTSSRGYWNTGASLMRPPPESPPPSCV